MPFGVFKAKKASSPKPTRPPSHRASGVDPKQHPHHLAVNKVRQHSISENSARSVRKASPKVSGSKHGTPRAADFEAKKLAKQAKLKAEAKELTDLMRSRLGAVPRAEAPAPAATAVENGHTTSTTTPTTAALTGGGKAGGGKAGGGKAGGIKGGNAIAEKAAPATQETTRTNNTAQMSNSTTVRTAAEALATLAAFEASEASYAMAPATPGGLSRTDADGRALTDGANTDGAASRRTGDGSQQGTARSNKSPGRRRRRWSDPEAMSVLSGRSWDLDSNGRPEAPAHKPEVLITAVPQSDDSAFAALPTVTPEAHAAQTAFGGPTKARVLQNASVSELDEALRWCSTWYFCGHGDALLAGENVLAFMDGSGAMQTVSIDALVSTVRPHVLHGRLKLIVLTGCCTLSLAEALRARAFVPYVMCWETRLLDEAALIFGRTFAEATAASQPPQRAYDAACQAVTTVTEPGLLDTGERSQVQKYELHVDPEDFTAVHPVYPLTLHSGRLRRYAELAGRGRLAVGKPRLLVPDETKLHGVPSLPKHLMRRPEQKEVRAALLGGASPDHLASVRSDRAEGGDSGHGGDAHASSLLVAHPSPPSPNDASSPTGGSPTGGSPLASAASFGNLDGSLRFENREASFCSASSRSDHGDSRGAAAPAVFTGIAGTAGLGKTALACWLCHDTLVRTAYRDGIFWLEFGREREGVDGLAHLARMLGMPHEEVSSLKGRNSTDLSDAVSQVLRGKHCLIVLDDVWDEDQPYAFWRFVNGGVTVLMTTRKTAIVQSYGTLLHALPVAPLEARPSLRLLVAMSGREHASLTEDSQDERSLDTLVRMCAGLPAMLRSVGRMCSGRSPLAVLQFFETHTSNQRMPKTMARSDGYNIDTAKGNLFYALEGQIDGLAEEDPTLVDRLTMLGVFADAAKVPLKLLMLLWGESDGAATDDAAKTAAEQGGGPPHPHHNHAGTIAIDEAEAREVVERLAGEHLVELRSESVPILGLDEGGTNHADGHTNGGGGAATTTATTTTTSSGTGGSLALSQVSSSQARGCLRLSSDGRAIELIEPVSAYLRCRGKARLPALHAQLLRNCAARDIGYHRGFWSADTFVHHLSGGGHLLRPGALQSVTRLNLAGVSERLFGDAGVRSLATLLQSNRILQSLAELQLDRNEITDAGAIALAQAIDAGALANLAILNLAHNRIGNAGFIALASRHGGDCADGAGGASVSSPSSAASATAATTAASSPVGGANASSSSPGGASADGERPISSIVSLDVSHNEIGDEGLKSLSAAVARGALPSCEVLDVTYNRISDAFLVELAYVLKQDGMPDDHEDVSRLTSLAELRLNGCRVRVFRGAADRRRGPPVQKLRIQKIKGAEGGANKDKGGGGAARSSNGKPIQLTARSGGASSAKPSSHGGASSASRSERPATESDEVDAPLVA